MSAQLLAVALGGAIGATARFIVSSGVTSWLGRGFPYGTVFVNVVGSFLIGVLYVVLTERAGAHPLWRDLLVVGILGGFTTFSSFSIETVVLLEQQAIGRAVANVLFSVTVCLLATWLAIIVTRRL